MSNIILPKVQILDTISDEAKMLIEQNGEINRFAVTNLGGGDISINLEDTIYGNANPINADTLDGKSENMLSVANANTLEGYSVQSLFDKIYPVGSIYMAVNAVSPATLFGGTWEALEGKFLLGASSNYSAGSIGGEAEHTLTVDEIPSHTHDVKRYTSGGELTGNALDTAVNIAGTIDNAYGAMATGGSQPHNNMPPYLAVYMWKRTA